MWRAPPRRTTDCILSHVYAYYALPPPKCRLLFCAWTCAQCALCYVCCLTSGTWLLLLPKDPHTHNLSTHPRTADRVCMSASYTKKSSFTPHVYMLSAYKYPSKFARWCLQARKVHSSKRARSPHSTPSGTTTRPPHFTTRESPYFQARRGVHANIYGWKIFTCAMLSRVVAQA